MSATTTSSAMSSGPVLVVYPFCLDHVGHGNIQRILAIARYLAASGVAVDLVYQGSPRVPKVEAQYTAFRRVFAVDGGASSSDEQACATRLAAFYSGHDLPPAHMRPSAPLTALVRGLLDAEPYRAVVATYAFTAPIFAGLSRRVLTVCDVQDIMHEHAEACERATGQASSFTMPAATEAFLWRQWDVLVAITPDDQARIARDLLPAQHLVTARHAAPCASAAAPGRDDVALYAASDNQSNVQAVTWLLEHVWPRVRALRPTARLRVVGLICGAVPAAVRDTPGLELLGFMNDVADEVAACGVLVAPYLYGSGLKIKVVEAACAGKAVVTTTSGLAGTGLSAGRALAVHDDPAAFAAALAGLLGDSARRAVLGEAARHDAAALFSAEACYGPIAVLIRLLGSSGATDAASDPIAASVVDRVRLVVDQLRPERVIVWGNGGHTRSLLRAFADADITVHAIVDGRAILASTSPEGLPVVPASEVGAPGAALVVLSSETFETEMWRDLAAYRQHGGYVLGLSHPRYVSHALLARLTAPLRINLGAIRLASVREGDQAAVVLWDSAATPERWWRVRRQCDLAGAVARAGAAPVLASPSTLASRPDVLEESSLCAQVLPVIELSGADVEARDDQGGADGLARAVDVVTESAHAAMARLHLREHDVVVALEPSLAECFALARAIAALPARQRPAVALWAPPVVRPTLNLECAEQQAYWRLAMSAVTHAAGGRCAVVSPDAAEGARVGRYLRRDVAVVAQPAMLPTEPTSDGRRTVLCLGQVSMPSARPTIEALSAATAPSGLLRGVRVLWRSAQADARPGVSARWAVDLSRKLDVTLLDHATPDAMAAAVAGADAVAILSPSLDGWAEAARALAAAAGVPVVLPATPEALVARLQELMSAATNPHPSLTNAADSSLAAVLMALERSLFSNSHSSSAHALVTETCS